MWRNHPKEYEVLLKKGWNILQLTAYRCADCRVIIINEDDCQYKFHYAKIESLMFYLIVSLQNKKITINKGGMNMEFSMTISGDTKGRLF